MRDELDRKGAERSAPFFHSSVFLGPRDKPEDDGLGVQATEACSAFT